MARSLATRTSLNHPGFLGGSIPWKGRWSYANREDPREAVHAALHPAEREQAVRLVRQLRGELGTDQGTVARVAKQLGYGVESVRAWVNQADIDGGVKDGTSTEDAKRIKELEQEVKELRRANEILRRRPRISPRRSSTAHRGDGVVHRRAPRPARGRAHLRCAAGGPEHLLRGQEAPALGAGGPRRHVEERPLRALEHQPQGLRGPQALEGGPACRARRRPGPGRSSHA